MDTTNTQIQHQLDSITCYLTPLLPIANCHLVDFLTEDHWETRLPKSLGESLDPIGLDDFVEQFWKCAEEETTDNTELGKWIRNARENCVRANDTYCLTRDRLVDRLTAWGGEVKPEIKVKEFMKIKKSYEIHTMANLVASLHGLTSSKCCVEVGGGRGPLLTSLSLSYGVPSLTIDCEKRAVKIGAERAAKMKKKWHTIAKPEEGTSVIPVASDHRFAAAFVTSKTDLSAIARKTFPEYPEDEFNLLLTGLHTCGNLGPDSLKIFASQPSVSAIFNSPCCHHLLNESVDESKFDAFQRDYGDKGIEDKEIGFPMSQYLKGLNLGRNARNLANQSIERVVSEKKLPKRSLLYRALLQVLMKKHKPNTRLACEARLNRVLRGCRTFENYIKLADSKLNLKLFDTISNADLLNININIETNWKRLVMFYLLRLCLAQVVESVILLDRLLFLFENGLKNVFLVKLFDPVISPRCHAIVAIKGDKL